jgi:hypothetical protein
MNPRYPKTVDNDNQFTPELMELWHEAMVDLRARRNRALRWQVPTFVVFWLVALIILGPLVIALGIVVAVGFGLALQALRPNYDYTVSDDQTSAKFHLNHIFRLKYFLEYPMSVLAKGKNGFGDLVFAIIAFFTLPIWWGFTSFFYAFEFLNYMWWLKGFTEWTGRLQKTVDGGNGKQHLRGTNILPSVQLSGTAPTGAAPPPIQQEPLEVLDGLLTLLPDGGIALAGGIAFDRNSTFSDLSMNGLTLTRETEAQLKVSHEGSDKWFRFDGNSWLSV